MIQSDNEFACLAFEESCMLLGSTQIFSTALRPQSQGVVERSHVDLRAALAILAARFVTRALRKAALKENDMFVSRTNALGGKDVRLSVAPRGNELVAVVVAEKSGAPSEPIGAG